MLVLGEFILGRLVLVLGINMTYTYVMLHVYITYN